MLSLVRTHYIIDLITGVIFAHYSFIQAERISYVTDVIVLGIGNSKVKSLIHFSVVIVSTLSTLNIP